MSKSCPVLYGEFLYEMVKTSWTYSNFRNYAVFAVVKEVLTVSVL